MSRVRVAAVGEVPQGEGRVIDVAGRTLALFNVEGTHYAVDNMCIHRGGPLGDGDLDGTTIACPWHGWRWSVVTGENLNNPAIKMPCFPVTVAADQVWVELP